MKMIEYTAINEDHKVCKGKLHFRERPHFASILEAQKLRLIEYKVVDAVLPKSLTYLQLLFIIRSLKCYLSSGMMISDAVDRLIEVTSDKRLRNVLRHVSHQIRSGELFSQAIKPMLPKGDMVSLSLLNIAESTGCYSEVLVDVERYAQWQLEMRRQVSQSVRYPWMVLGVLWIALFCLLYLFTPQLASYLEQTQVETPALTLGLLWLSRKVVAWPEVWFLIPVAGVVVFKLVPRLSSSLEYWLIQVPGFREMILEYYYSICFRVISLQLKHGYTLVESIQGLKRSNQGTRLEKLIEKVLERVSSGVPLGEVLSQYPSKYVFPLAAQLIQVGEQSNTLYENLVELSTYYTASFQRRVDGFVKIIEPVLLVVMGVVVGIFVIGLFYPLYQQMGDVISAT